MITTDHGESREDFSGSPTGLPEVFWGGRQSGRGRTRCSSTFHRPSSPLTALHRPSSAPSGRLSGSSGEGRQHRILNVVPDAFDFLDLREVEHRRRADAALSRLMPPHASSLRRTRPQDGAEGRIPARPDDRRSGAAPSSNVRSLRCALREDPDAGSPPERPALVRSGKGRA